MEKDYVILDENVRLTAEEIEREYDGLWVFIINAEYNGNYGFTSGTPLIVAKEQFGGREDGIYRKYIDSDEYGIRTFMSFLPRRVDISSNCIS